MSDLNIYADQTAIDALTPITGDVVLRASDNAVLLYNGSAWKEFQPDAGPAPFLQYSVDFDGTNDYIDTGTSFQSTFQSDFTISTWFKDEATSGVRGFYGLRANTSPFNDITSYSEGHQITFWIKYNGGRKIAALSHTRDSNWHHLVLKLNQNGSNIEMRGYLDGVFKLSTSYAQTMSSWVNPGTFAIGARAYDTHGPDIYFDGKQDEFAIFGSALSDGGVSVGQTAGGDIATLYNSGVPADISSLSPVTWYRMGENDGGTGSTITDQGVDSNGNPSGNDGTLMNGANIYSGTLDPNPDGAGPDFSSSVPS